MGKPISHPSYGSGKAGRTDVAHCTRTEPALQIEMTQSKKKITPHHLKEHDVLPDRSRYIRQPVARGRWLLPQTTDYIPRGLPVEFAQTPDTVLDSTIVFQARVWEPHELRNMERVFSAIRSERIQGPHFVGTKFAVEERA
ncbi:MAG: hypothetical protein EXS16_10250 [Gemmataceae bacterium]|nr:hypothetical protein [Gemmataceae bacterium]